MSWTIQRSDDVTPAAIAHNKALDRLQVALEQAKRNKILLFCSAPDIGVSSSRQLSSYLPFGCTSIPGMFKIGAANADGTINGWAGNPEFVDFILPGQNVSVKDDDKVNTEDQLPKTGSSVATALAAGLAALLIQCVRMGALYDHFFLKGMADGNTIGEIKKFDVMKKALKLVSHDYNEKDKRLEVETFFTKPGRDLGSEGLTEEEKWKKISILARDLVMRSS